MNSASSPRVSIGLPTYNGARTLPTTLQTLCAQRYPNLEIIVSDNASDDGTAAILSEYAGRDPRIRYVRQEQGIGEFANFSFVLSQAQGKYFMWAADDDRWEPEFVPTLVELLEARPECGVAMSSYARLNRETDSGDTVELSGELDLTAQDPIEVYRRMIYGAPIHIFIYGLFRREFLLHLWQRARPTVVHWDRVLMAEAALATGFGSAAPVLHAQIRNPIPPKKRTTNRFAVLYYQPFVYTRYALALITRPLSSPLVPGLRKLQALPIWGRFVWSIRKRLFFDWVRAVRRKRAAAAGGSNPYGR